MSLLRIRKKSSNFVPDFNKSELKLNRKYYAETEFILYTTL